MLVFKECKFVLFCWWSLILILASDSSLFIPIYLQPVWNGWKWLFPTTPHVKIWFIIQLIPTIWFIKKGATSHILDPRNLFDGYPKQNAFGKRWRTFWIWTFFRYLSWKFLGIWFKIWSIQTHHNFTFTRWTDQPGLATIERSRRRFLGS